MGTLVFDSNGRGWDARSPALRAVVQSHSSRLGVLAYMVDVLGFVAVTTTRRGFARIRLRPAQVSQVSLGAALFAIADERPRWIVVSRPSDRARDELFPSVSRAFNRIAELVEHEGPPLCVADDPELADGLYERDCSVVITTGSVSLDSDQGVPADVRPLRDDVECTRLGDGLADHVAGGHCVAGRKAVLSAIHAPQTIGHALGQGLVTDHQALFPPVKI
jgi:hypothetical protein